MHEAPHDPLRPPEKLDTAKIHYTLSHHRDDAIMFNIAVPGERWEVEFFPTGEIEIEVFRTTGTIEDASAIDRLFECFTD